MVLCMSSLLPISLSRSQSGASSRGLPDFLEMKKVLDAYEEKMKEEQAKLEQKEAALKSKGEHFDVQLQEKEEESRRKMEVELADKIKQLHDDRETLEAERRDWEEEKERVKQTKVFEKVVTLDVGGTKYRTTLSTLTKYPDSMLGAMFSGRHDLPQQEDGSYFIDRDGEPFQYILMYLRDREFCFDFLHNSGLRSPQDLPSPLERALLKKVACEAAYLQIRELETLVRIILNASGYQYPAIKLQKCGYSNTKVSHLDYSQGQFSCGWYTNEDSTFTYQLLTNLLSGRHGVEFTEKITFESCDLSGTTFRNCYFQQGVSFEGCILRGTKFEHVGGLISHKVHFAPWQVAQADFEPELLQALKDNGCIY